MRKKRFPKSNSVRVLTESNIIRIGEEINGQLFFEIGSEITTDIAEAVAIMMRVPNIDDLIWNKELPFDVENIDPKKTLYWLSGGDKEWITLQNYNQPWSKCVLEFQEEFGFMVLSIIGKAKKLKDIRDGYIKYLNLPVLYEFALSQNFVK
jgi:hypothetical protein